MANAASDRHTTRAWTRALQRAYRSSPRDVVSALRKRLGAGAPAVAAPARPDEAFLRSAEYAALMARHLPWDGSYDRHEAQNETRNYRFRHGEAARRLGVFRWRGMQTHLDSILSLVAAPGRKVIDFGGAGGPLGLGSLVVDQLEHDVWGRPVPHRTLEEAGRDVDVVFSSHALEHVEPLDDVLRSMHACLKPEGHLVLHVPSFHCERWRAGVHRNRLYNDHVWTFGLGPLPEGIACHNYADIALEVKKRFTPQVAEYCGDDSILIIARKS